MNSINDNVCRGFLKSICKVSLLIVSSGLLINLSCTLNKHVSSTANSDSLRMANAQAALVDTEYYLMVEKPPVFQNGDVNTFITYLKKNIHYPGVALKKKQQGTVAIQFGVDCYGVVNVFSVLKSSGIKSLDNEAQRAIKASPKWTPAKVGNKSVGKLMVLQIKFSAVTKKIEIN